MAARPTERGGRSEARGGARTRLTPPGRGAPTEVAVGVERTREQRRDIGETADRGHLVSRLRHAEAGMTGRALALAGEDAEATLRARADGSRISREEAVEHRRRRGHRLRRHSRPRARRCTTSRGRAAARAPQPLRCRRTRSSGLRGRRAAERTSSRASARRQSAPRQACPRQASSSLRCRRTTPSRSQPPTLVSSSQSSPHAPAGARCCGRSRGPFAFRASLSSRRAEERSTPSSPLTHRHHMTWA